MFVFKPTKQTYSDPVSATFLPGLPFGREKSRGDICLLHEGFAASKVFLNSIVLREALLNSKDFLEEVLDIKITDKQAKDAVPKKATKKEVEEAEVYIGEEKPEPKKEKPKKASKAKPAEEIFEEVKAEPVQEEAPVEEPKE